MENDYKTIITKELSFFLKKRKIFLKYDYIYTTPKTLINKLINNKNKRIKIYDITNVDKKIKKINIENHINKTGENPLIGNQKKLKIDFLDITSIYSYKNKKGETTTSLGKKQITKENKEKNPSTELSNIAIVCKALKFEKIEGFLINANYRDWKKSQIDP